MANADKRKVSTDALETLGNIIGDGEHRDAIHLAVEPIEAAHDLFPGQHVGVVDGKANLHAPKKLGIVDPFIVGFVPKGKKFWLVIYPRQITSLRHVWSHPDLPEVVETPTDPKESPEYREAAEWMRAYADKYGFTMKRMVDAGIEWLDSGTWFIDGGTFEGESVPETYWDNFEILTGRKVPRMDRENFFSCSC